MLLTYLFLLLVFEPILYSIAHRNNVCKTFGGYYFPDLDRNCYYDPDITLQNSEIIEKHAGKVEVYNVTSEDGYILNMLRVPKKNPKGVVLIHHSIATNSRIYLWQGNDSLAIALWRNGFDVWLANQRGTLDSDNHVNLTSHDYRYWNFSVHEMGLYDVTSELNFIRSRTNNSKVIFIGHSLGSTIGVIYTSLKSLEAKSYLKAMILLAAPVYFSHGTSLVYSIVPLTPIIKTVVELLHIGSPLLFLPALIPISKVVLRILPTLLFIVNVFVWALCGYTPSETDPTFFNYDGVLYADNFSWKTLIHFGQLAATKDRFQMYDYGKEENMRIYGQEVPPLYPLEKISVPTLLISSDNDSLISYKDVDRFYQELSPEARTYGHWIVPGLNHLDYHLGLHRIEVYRNKLLKFINSL